MSEKPNYGIDAPNVLRNFFLFGVPALLFGIFGPDSIHIGNVILRLRPMFLVTGSLTILEGFLYLFYVKYGKFRHRDIMLSLHTWRGDERVLDVGCGRGLLLVGAAKLLPAGHATGIDIWSREDMAGNSEAATERNMHLENVTSRCTLVSAPAQEMPFAQGEFDLVVSNLCLHNIYQRPTREQALRQIVRVLKPGGEAIISDYKLTGEYAKVFRDAGLSVTRKWGNPLYTFPPLRIVVARKPIG